MDKSIETILKGIAASAIIVAALALTGCLPEADPETKAHRLADKMAKSWCTEVRKNHTRTTARVNEKVFERLNKEELKQFKTIIAASHSNGSRYRLYQAYEERSNEYFKANCDRDMYKHILYNIN